MKAHSTDAAAIGIDDAFISNLVDAFYARIRIDERLGPIFNGAIGERWDVHLARMKDFWASVALHAGRYSGQPVPVHKRLSQVEVADFDHWLRLFRDTLEMQSSSSVVVDFFMERAERIAMSLKLAMFGSRGEIVRRLPIV